jgi:hypothetical protein
MPAQLDLGPASLALWLKQYGGGGPPVSTLADPLGGTLPGEGPAVVVYGGGGGCCRPNGHCLCLLMEKGGAAGHTVQVQMVKLLLCSHSVVYVC